MKKGRPKKLNKQELVGEPIKLQLKSLGRIYKSEGATFDEAIGKIKISGGARVMSVLTIEKDEVKKEKLLNARYSNLLFGGGSPTTRLIHMKQIKMFLGV